MRKKFKIATSKGFDRSDNQDIISLRKLEQRLNNKMHHFMEIKECYDADDMDRIYFDYYVNADGLALLISEYGIKEQSTITLIRDNYDLLDKIIELQNIEDDINSVSSYKLITKILSIALVALLILAAV